MSILGKVIYFIMIVVGACIAYPYKWVVGDFPRWYTQTM